MKMILYLCSLCHLLFTFSVVSKMHVYQLFSTRIPHQQNSPMNTEVIGMALFSVLARMVLFRYVGELLSGYL